MDEVLDDWAQQDQEVTIAFGFWIVSDEGELQYITGEIDGLRIEQVGKTIVELEV